MANDNATRPGATSGYVATGTKARLAVRLFLIALFGGAVLWTFAHRAALSVTAVEAWIRNFGFWAPVIFATVYAVGTVLFLPGSVLTIVAGALFGPIWGTAYSLVGATTGATVAFLISRFLAGDWVARKAGGRLRQLIEGVEAEGWRFVAFVRLVPLFPFNFLNYALGLTRIRLAQYVLATAVCILPGGFAFTYLGYAGRQAAAGDERAVEAGLVALALIAIAVFLPRFVRRLRKARP